MIVGRMSWPTLLIMQNGTICLWRLAAYVASMAQTDSVRRRFYRFFQFVRLDSTLAARVVVELLGLGGSHGFWLSIGRTGVLARPRSNPDDIGDMERHGIPLLWMLRQEGLPASRSRPAVRPNVQV
jgi:hypothetical protein